MCVLKYGREHMKTLQLTLPPPHLVSVVNEIAQQVVHVQDPSFAVLQVVGLHFTAPMLETNTPVSTQTFASRQHFKNDLHDITDQNVTCEERSLSDNSSLQ